MDNKLQREELNKLNEPSSLRRELKSIMSHVGKIEPFFFSLDKIKFIALFGSHKYFF